MTVPNPAVLHQALQPTFKLDSPLVDSNGRLSPPWNRLFLYLLQSVGNGNIPQVSSVQLISQGNDVIAVDNKGNVLGTLNLENQPGPPEQVLAVGASPFVYPAHIDGTLLVNKGQLELARSGMFYVVSPMGGAVRLLNGDKARVTWFTSDPAEVIWFPDN